MSTRQHPSPAPGPDLLARYLNAYLQARQLSDIERPWGLGDDRLDGLWARLSGALGADVNKLNQLVAEELQEIDRFNIVETIVPLIFALPLRAYPAELRAIKTGPRLLLSLRHLDVPGSVKSTEQAESAAAEGVSSKKHREHEGVEWVGHLPSALIEAFSSYLRIALRFPEEKQRSTVTISSGGRRRRVRVTILAHNRGAVIRFLERLHSPGEDGA